MTDFEIKNLVHKCYNENEKSKICDDLKKFIQCTIENKNIQNLQNIQNLKVDKQISPEYTTNITIMKDIINKHKIIGDNICFLTKQMDLYSISKTNIKN
jgi:hypothetical protein